uniref:Methionine adenosyltransferase 2 subunit beta n=1 Tax=Nothobranchius pienaari TaxID=704102 RepID=A0A1A8M8M2_9TELE
MRGHQFSASQEEALVQGPRVVVTGATGLLGRAICQEFESGGWIVIGTGYRRARPRFLRCDLTDEIAVKRLLHEHKPEVVIHCAAERRPDVMEGHNEAAVNLNVHATSTLAKESVQTMCLMVGILHTVKMTLQILSMSMDEANWMEACRESTTGKEQMTKYEMAVAMAQAFNLPSNHLIPRTELSADMTSRPMNCQLNCSRLELLNLSVEPQAFTAAITDCLWPFTADKRWRQTVFH